MRERLFFPLRILLGVFCAGPGVFAGCLGQNLPRKSIPELRNDLANSVSEREKAGLLLDLALGYVYKPGSGKTDLDSALLLTKQAEACNGHLRDQALEARVCFLYSNIYREGQRPDQGHIYCQRSVDLYKGLSRPAELGQAYEELGQYYDGNTREGITEQIRVNSLALEAYRGAGLIEKQAGVLQYLGDLNQINKNYGLALAELRESLALYTATGHKALQGIYDLMDGIYSDIGDPTNAVKYGLLAVRTAEAVGDTTLQLCTIYNRLGVSYSNWGKYKETFDCLKKSYAIALRYRHEGSVMIVLLNLCMLTPRGEWQESVRAVHEALACVRLEDVFDTAYVHECYVYAYMAGNKAEEAGRYARLLKEAIPRLETDNSMLATIYRCLVKYYLFAHDYSDARKYAEVYIAFFRRLGYGKKSLATAYYAKSEADSALGDFRAALADNQAYMRLEDSLFNESKSLQFAQMQVEYETEKKEKDIQLLKNTNRLQAGRLREERLSRNIIVVSLASLLALVFTGYYFKRRSNRKLEVKQGEINQQNLLLTQNLTEKSQLLVEKNQMLAEKNKLVKEKDWLVKEIHHRVKNNLQIIISLLNAQLEFLDNEGASHAIQESRERMQAIAILHQKLYQQDSGALIDMRSYIREMVSSLEYSFTGSRDPGMLGGYGQIRFELVIDEIGLDISQSVPLGLILNEAITNALKYAYPVGEGGVICISMIRLGGERILLKVADRGRGLPVDFDPDKSHSLGTQLMKLFAEQLEGELEFRQGAGLGGGEEGGEGEGAVCCGEKGGAKRGEGEADGEEAGSGIWREETDGDRFEDVFEDVFEDAAGRGEGGRDVFEKGDEDPVGGVAGDAAGGGGKMEGRRRRGGGRGLEVVLVFALQDYKKGMGLRGIGLGKEEVV